MKEFFFSGLSPFWPSSVWLFEGSAAVEFSSVIPDSVLRARVFDSLASTLDALDDANVKVPARLDQIKLIVFQLLIKSLF